MKKGWARGKADIGLGLCKKEETTLEFGKRGEQTVVFGVTRTLTNLRGIKDENSEALFLSHYPGKGKQGLGGK